MVQWLSSWLAEQRAGVRFPVSPIEFQRWFIISCFQVVIWLKCRWSDVNPQYNQQQPTNVSLEIFLGKIFASGGKLMYAASKRQIKNVHVQRSIKEWILLYICQICIALRYLGIVLRILHCFNSTCISFISQLGRRRYQISEVIVARPGLEHQTSCVANQELNLYMVKQSTYVVLKLSKTWR